MKQFTVLAFLVLSSNSKSFSQNATKTNWVTTEIGMDFHLNEYLFINTEVIGFVCNENGEPSYNGNYVYIKNYGAKTFYYRASAKGVGNYGNKSSTEYITTVQNALEYYDVPGNASKVISLNDYRSKSGEELKTNVYLDIKYTHYSRDPKKEKEYIVKKEDFLKRTKNLPNTKGKTDPYSNAEGSTDLLIDNIPKTHKFYSSIAAIIEYGDIDFGGNKLEKEKDFLPANLTEDMNDQQKIYFKNFVEDISFYMKNMWSSLVILTNKPEGGYGYKYPVDLIDKHYRDNVLNREDMSGTLSYNSYSTAIYNKAKAAYDLLNLIGSEPNSSRQVKNNLKKYSLAAIKMVPEGAEKDLLEEKKSLNSKLQE